MSDEVAKCVDCGDRICLKDAHVVFLNGSNQILCHRCAKKQKHESETVTLNEDM